MVTTSSTQRQRREASESVRKSILNAAAHEFASHGFEGASTRVIAERSGVHQAQLGYHVGTKDELWKATLDHLFERLRRELDRALPISLDRPLVDPVETFAEIIRLHVRHTAQHPELSRIMLMETATRSERVTYLLKHHVRPTLAALQLMWAEVQSTGRGNEISAEEVFMFMIGLSPIPFAQAGMMRSLLGVKQCTAEAHAELMIRWILQ